jgi:hypothetical protein
VGEEIVALRIKGKGSVFHRMRLSPGRLSQALLEWKAMQETFKGYPLPRRDRLCRFSLYLCRVFAEDSRMGTRQAGSISFAWLNLTKIRVPLVRQ